MGPLVSILHSLPTKLCCIEFTLALFVLRLDAIEPGSEAERDMLDVVAWIWALIRLAKFGRLGGLLIGTGCCVRVILLDVSLELLLLLVFILFLLLKSHRYENKIKF